MMTRVLFATDLSEASAKVLGCVDFLRGLGAREAVLFFSVNIRDAGHLSDRLLKDFRAPLEDQARILEGRGIRTRIEIVQGIPALEILRAADAGGFDLIVVGSHGRGLLERAWLGGTAAKVVQGARRPVLVVRLKIVEEKDRRTCELASADLAHHVLHPTDFSDAAERAFAEVVRIVESGGRRVTLLHVQDRGKIDPNRLDEYNRVDRDRLERLERILREKGAETVSIEIPYGSPAHEILERAGRDGVSLIVMGSQGRGFLKEIFLGGVADRVVKQAPVPVMLVPAPR